MADKPPPTPGVPTCPVDPDGEPLLSLPKSVYPLDMSSDVTFKTPVIFRAKASGTLKYIPWGHCPASPGYCTDTVTDGQELRTPIRTIFSTANGSTGVTAGNALHHMKESPVA